MSLTEYYVSHLRLLALRHHWTQVEQASAALDDALLTADPGQIESALALLDSSLSEETAHAPHQVVRQAREHSTVLRRLTTAPEA